MASFLGNIGNKLGSTTADLLSNSDFINRSVGMANSYEDIMFIVQALGREPISLLGKDYLYIFDHVRRNYNMGSNVMDYNSNECPKFTFYKEKPTVRFANPYDDPKNLLDRWIPNVDFESTSQRNILLSYAESDDDKTNNKVIGTSYGIDNANPGINFGGISSFANSLSACDLIRKTNDNFNHGKYRTLIARFHTNSDDSKRKDDITQTALTEKYGMSHGRNLLRKYSPNHVDNGYDNPYCRVWTYHHQYNQLARAIRPFDLQSAEMLEKSETSSGYDTVGFRTVENKKYGFDGGSKRLDTYGVLNYKNGMVNIAPTAKIKDYFEHKEDDEKAVSTKKCMFSIENLAWKSSNVAHDEYDQFGLSPEQKGPLGGRIMWFPPYDLTFSESVRVNWNQNQFIGRGEKVYTYTDTERTGNLSFTLLIDHPSILDYWTGHERNGMKNGGNQLIPGNRGGADEINNQENTLLRFFAGCEVLTAKPQEFRKRVRVNEKKGDVERPQVKKDPQETEVHKPSGKKTLYCFAFYPNNYSGMNDAPTNKASKVNAIHYLLNGIGTQRIFNPTTKRGENFSVDVNNAISVNGASGAYGGYEMQDDNTHGISVATKILGSIAAINKTYSGATEYVQFLTDENGNKYSVNEGDLTKYSWDGALKQSQAKKNQSINKLWYKYRYYYRVDSNTLSQNLKKPESYIDSKSYQYNQKGIYNQINNLKEEFGIDFDKNTDIVSLTDMYIALEGNSAALSGKYDDTKVKLIKEIKNNTERFKIVNISFFGNASIQGNNASSQVNSNRNNSLAKNRWLTLKNWMNDKGFPGLNDAKGGLGKSVVQKSGNKSDVNNEITKLWRSAYVKIEYEESSFEDAALSNPSSVTNEVDASGNSLSKLDKTEIPNGLSSKKVNTAKDWLEQTEEGKKFKAQYEADRWKNMKIVNGEPVFDRPQLDPWTFTMQTANKYGDRNYTDTNSWNYDNSYLQKQTGVVGVQKGTVERYDNEGEFFKLLEKNDPFMHHLITDKIKYFDPAFHSISPEGFNARLTFLHQCTRQGSTVGNSDNLPGTAYNLAFGRPPVCVLRLGDFYYTKIIINSINIQYDTPQWDLNPEGIGVMPMFAKVTLDFAFLGGSDLAGPISRLQNAVSFNYYANTGVYDNRAEMVQYDEDGNGHEVKFKPYSYPDMIEHGLDNYKEVNSDITEKKEATIKMDIKPLNPVSIVNNYTEEKFSGRNIVKVPLTTSSTSPQVKPTQTTNTSTNSGNLSQENQELVNSWTEAHPADISQQMFEEFMDGVFDEALSGNLSSITFLETILIKDSSNEFDWNPSHLISKETCTDADINYIKEQYTLNGLGYGPDSIGTVYIKGKNYLINKDALPYASQYISQYIY